ncbi:hypothetical protein ACHAWF_014396 [Thalassiosira exigua]
MVLTMAWKSGETMLTQFADGVGPVGKEFLGPHNGSAPHSGLLGWGCDAGNLREADGGSDGPCPSLLLERAGIVLGGAARAYLSSPLCLALLPLAVGLGLGFWMGMHGRNEGVSGRDGRTKETRAKLASLACGCYRWLAFRSTLALLRLVNPRAFFGGDSAPFEDERGGAESERESGVDPRLVPRHIAVIMDGNRRHGREKHGSAARGHHDGSRTLFEFSKWCMSEGVEALTVYAFSTENWDRDPAEVSALMAIFCKYCDELRVEAAKRGMCVQVLSTEEGRIPPDVREAMDRMVEETKGGDRFKLNICMSYGGRGEIVNACRGIAADVGAGRLNAGGVNEGEVRSRLLTGSYRDPDVVIRTSGEERLSNFLLWQVAYSEFFFLKKHWPELEKEDLLEVIRTFAYGRKRRFGK